ncbi:MAG: Spermidine/putrescine-binding periplasmic protein precursor [Deltaproteobacteria bacterium ADurb.Bin510]|nr:MAG: Spermidine/putrescine-binding periplasmic protein precursor [Deltaproteobacteria bacterium ADurb.Bin510]
MKRLILMVALLTALPVAAFAREEVYVYNWSEYINPAVIKQFEKETGIQVRYSTYDSNEAMYAKLKIVKKGGYDVAVPSTYFVDRMRKQGLLQPLNLAALPNVKYLNLDLMNQPYDPGNRYSVPYLWGSSAIGVNSRYVNPKSISSWNDLWKANYRGKVLLMDDVREVFAMALRSMGYSGNTTDPRQIERAYLKLKALKPSVKIFNSDSPRQPFLNSEVVIGQIWGGEVFMAAAEDPAIKLVYPKEGAIFWMDNLVIPRGARNVANAYKFINFMLRPDIAKMNCEFIGYATPNLKAQQMLAPAVRNNPAVYPDRATIKKGEFQNDVGDAILIYEKYWEMLKTER